MPQVSAEQFATELKQDSWIVTTLWKPDGSEAGSICIRKEVWLNSGNRFPDVPNDQKKFPVFHMFNYLDSSKAHSPGYGSRVNPPDEPFLKFEDALAVAKQHEAEALAGSEWVHVEDIKTGR